MGNTASFSERVYRLAARIPPGKVATYGQLAWMLSCPFGARAVGQAMAKAPGGLVPCHRVINAAGGLAPGFAFGGPEVQRGLLRREGVLFLPDGRVDLKRCLWRPQAELGTDEQQKEGIGMATLLYQGHGSYRITTRDGMVIYVDPYAGKGYDAPADLILVTHEHFDHNQVNLPAKKPGCRIIRADDALRDGAYGSFLFGPVEVEAVEACNSHHDRNECVGYLIAVDGITFYAAGDTSETEQMKTLAHRGLDWAALPIDGVYNMGPKEASACAALLGAGHVVPVHTKPGSLFDRAMAESFEADGRVILQPGQSVELTPAGKAP